MIRARTCGLWGAAWLSFLLVFVSCGGDTVDRPVDTEVLTEGPTAALSPMDTAGARPLPSLRELPFQSVPPQLPPSMPSAGGELLPIVEQTELRSLRSPPETEAVLAYTGDESLALFTQIERDARQGLYVSGLIQGEVRFGGEIVESPELSLFVARLDREGELVWIARSGAVAGVPALGQMAVAPEGEVYVTGTFRRRLRLGELSVVSAGQTDLFVAKLSPAGEWLWATSGGGIGNDAGHRIGVRGEHLVVAGHLTQTARFGELSATSMGGQDLYVARLDRSDGAFTALATAGSTTARGCEIAMGCETVTALAIDDAGMYVTGLFQDTAMFGVIPVTAATGVGSGAFVARLTVDDDALQWEWAQKLPQVGIPEPFLRYDNPSALSLDGDGNALLCGHVAGVAAGTPFVARFDVEGELDWLSTPRRASLQSGQCSGVAADRQGSVYTTGSFEGQISFTGAEESLQSAGGPDVYVVRWSPAGEPLWELRGGGEGTDVGADLLSLSDSTLLVTGTMDEPARFGNDEVGGEGVTDSFVWVLRY